MKAQGMARSGGVGGLRRFNGGMFLLHLIQAALILALSTDFKLPVTTAFLEFDESADQLVPVDNTLWEVPLGPLVASFLLVSALSHLAVTMPRIYQWYEANLGRGINYARWYEYSVSASIMIVVIGMLVGVYDLSALILLFAVNSAMIFFGLAMEVQNRDARTVNWTPFVLGCIIGIVPWVIITLYLFAPATREIGDVPTFVYGIYVSLFLFFNVFAVNMFLQYKRIGPWREYVFGERAYIFLSLTAKSALAWQVFAGTLRDV
jgi:heliorhodopsin